MSLGPWVIPPTGMSLGPWVIPLMEILLSPLAYVPVNSIPNAIATTIATTATLTKERMSILLPSYKFLITLCIILQL